MYAAEHAHADALAASRRAIRSGDLAAAERWMKLAERHWRCLLHASRQDDLTREARFARHAARQRARAAAKQKRRSERPSDG